VVGEDAQPAADREAGGNVGVGQGAVDAGNDAVFLVGVADRVAFERGAVEGADLSVAEVAALFLRPAVATQCHPAGIDDGPALFRLVADHRGQNGEGDVVPAADADVVHDKIEKDIHAGAYFGHPVEM